ncbi:MAG: hypothetical protein LBM71_00510 [Elusimicrobiota bacterium]|jgi:hypothetical protein|nr:hypothetical protein [Elusimicrobiota bacterium]
MEENIKNFKLRFKLKTGEEFEAEGQEAFILKEKEAFLNLIVPQKQNLKTRQINQIDFTEPKETGKTPAPFLQDSEVLSATDDLAIYKPAYLRQNHGGLPPQKEPQELPQPSQNLKNPSNYYNEPIKNSALQANISVWDKIVYSDGGEIILRRKDKNIKPPTAALIILSAAKILKNSEGLPALELAHALKVSGYLKPNERLDRILAGEIKTGALLFSGSKRGRLYRATQTGMAKAYTVAERTLLTQP